MQYVNTCKHDFCPSFISIFCYVFYLFFDAFLVIFSYGKSLCSFAYVNIYCAGAGITSLMSISD